MNMRAILFTILFILPVTMFAGIAGTYTISGYDSHTNLPYTGSLVITKSGHIYTGQWNFVGGMTISGTGIRKGKCLSFVFKDNPVLSNASPFGVQQYIIENNKISGPWTRFGDTLRGYETIVKVTP